MAMLDAKTVLRRLPVTALIWAIGIISCVLFFNFLSGAASTMSGGDFVMYATYIPYLIIVVCTAAAIWLGEQSFASLVISIVFALAFGIGTMLVASAWLADPAFVAALSINTPDGYVIQPLTARPMTVAIRVLVSFLLPTVTGAVCSWAYKKFFAGNEPKKKPVSEMSKSEKKAARQAKYKR